MTLHEVQVYLDREGASDLVAELVMKSTLSPNVFMEAVQLGIALLEGGNPVIQRSLFTKLQSAETSPIFFKVFHDKMREAQAEIRSTMSVNTSEMTSSSGDGAASAAAAGKRTSSRAATVDSGASDFHGTDESTTATLSAVGSTLEDLLAEQNKADPSSSSGSDSSRLSPKVTVMLPVFRFLQLLCENHNRDLQNFLRIQPNKNSYNLVSETLMFLDCICGSTTGELGLLGLYINESNVALINQTLETLTEYCQGPCHENQNCIATHESNGLDIITALLVTDINPLGQWRMDLVLELKNNASKLLLAVMESRGDSENAERILYNMNPKQLVDVACRAFHQKPLHLEDDEDLASPKEVGHNIYILCHQLAQHNKELAALQKPSEGGDPKTNMALQYYANHTAQIEIVRHDRTMEQIVFPIPEMCEYLTHDTKVRVFNTAERDDQGSKVAEFFQRVDDMFDEMKWQKKLRGMCHLFLLF